MFPDTNANGIVANPGTVIAGVAGKSIYLFAAQCYAAAADVAIFSDGAIVVKMTYGAGVTGMGHDCWPDPIKFRVGQSISYSALNVNQSVTVNFNYTIA